MRPITIGIKTTITVSILATAVAGAERIRAPRDGTHRERQPRIFEIGYFL
jgi:hypothetical protein